MLLPKQNTFSPKQFQLEGSEFQNNLQNFFPGTQTTRNKFLKPALSISSPYNDMFVLAKTENQKIGDATSSGSK